MLYISAHPRLRLGSTRPDMRALNSRELIRAVPTFVWYHGISAVTWFPSSMSSQGIANYAEVVVVDVFASGIQKGGLGWKQNLPTVLSFYGANGG